MGRGASIRPSEPKSRRPTWRRGTKVGLADGASWHLPKIDLVLLMVFPSLLGDLIKACDMADDIQLADDGGKEHALGLMVYHAHMASFGVNLLKVNYDLPDVAWERLLQFGDLGEMTAMTSIVSRQIADSAAAWFPLFLTSGPDGVENLALN